VLLGDRAVELMFGARNSYEQAAGQPRPLGLI